MGTAANVRVGAGGAIYFDADATLPTNATSALTGFTDLGYVSEDGVTMTVDSSQEKINAWGGDVVRTVNNEHSVTFDFTFLELNDEVAKTYTGDEAATAASMAIANTTGRRGRWIIQVNDDPNVVRVVIPDGQVIATGDLSFQTSQAIGFPITIEAYPDGSGKKAYIYHDADGEA